MKLVKATAILTLLLTGELSFASPPIHPEAIMLCHGVGETVGQIHHARKEGRADSDNEGVALLRELEDELQQDLLTPIDNFLKQTQKLPPRWSAALFTHACLFDYTENLPQVALMSKLVSQHCDLALSSAACIEQVFSEMPTHQPI